MDRQQERQRDSSERFSERVEALFGREGLGESPQETIRGEVERWTSKAIEIIEDWRKKLMTQEGAKEAGRAALLVAGGYFAIRSLSNLIGFGKEAQESQDRQRSGTLRRILTFLFGAGAIGGLSAGAVSRLRSGIEEQATEKAEEARDRLGREVEQIPESQELEPSFNRAKEEVENYVEGWREVASMVGFGEGMIQEVKDRIGGISFRKFMAHFGERAGDILRNPKENMNEIREWFLEECRGVVIVDEYFEKKMENPNEKAESITKRGMGRLSEHLREKGVGDEIMRTFERLKNQIVSNDYTSVSADTWGELTTLIRNADVGLELKNREGIMVLMDYENLTDMGVVPNSYILGFSPEKDGQEVLDLPRFYFGRHSILKVREGMREYRDAFLDAVRDGIGSGAVNTREVLDNLETGWMNPETYKRILEALQKDAKEGNVVYGIGKTGALILWNNGWVIIQNSWSTVASSLSTLVSTSWRENIPRGLQAAAIEYGEGAAPMAVIYGIPSLLLAFTGARKWGLLKAMANVVAMPGMVVWRTGRMVVGAGEAGYRAAGVGSDMVRSFRHRDLLLEYYKNHYTNQNYIRRFMPERMRMGLLGSTWSNSRLLEIQDRARRVASLEHYDSLLSVEMQRSYGSVRSLRREIDATKTSLNEVVEEYIRKNFRHAKQGVFRGVPDEMVRNVSDSVVEEYGRRFTRGYTSIRIEPTELQGMIDREVLRYGGRGAAGLERQVDQMDQLERRRQEFFEEARRRPPTDEAKLATRNRKLARLHEEITSMENRLIGDQITRMGSDTEALRRFITETPTAERTAGEALSNFRNALDVNLETGRRMDQLVADRVARIDRLGVNSEAARTLAKGTNDLVKEFVGAQRQQIELLGREYKNYRELLKRQGVTGPIRDLARKNPQLREFDELWNRAVLGRSGGSGVTRVLRSSKGRLKLGGILLVPTLYMQYRDMEKQAAANEAELELLQIISELGPEAVQLVADIASPFGITDWYTVWTGKEAITGEEVNMRHRVSRFIWGTFAGVSDTVMAVGVATSWTGVGAGAAGVAGGGSRMVRASRALARAGASRRVIDKFPRIMEIMRQLGPKNFYETLKNAPGILSGTRAGREAIEVGRAVGQGGIRTGLRLTEIAAGRAMCADLALTVGGTAYQAVFGHDIEDPGFEPPPDRI